MPKCVRLSLTVLWVRVSCGVWVELHAGVCHTVQAVVCDCCAPVCLHPRGCMLFLALPQTHPSPSSL